MYCQLMFDSNQAADRICVSIPIPLLSMPSTYQYTKLRSKTGNFRKNCQVVNINDEFDTKGYEVLGFIEIMIGYHTM